MLVTYSVSASLLPGFSKLLDRVEEGDILIVTKLDRNAMDVRTTIEALSSKGVRVHCLALGGVDLTSAAGRMTMQVLSTVAEFERDLLIERTNAGLERARAEGKALERPSALSAKQHEQVLAQLRRGATVAGVATEYRTSRQTIMRVRTAGMAVSNCSGD